MSTYLIESLNSIAQSSASINALTFRRTHGLSTAVLLSEGAFETHMIRDAEPYELALFRPTVESRYDALGAVLVGEGEAGADMAGIAAGGHGNGAIMGGDEKWSATKRTGPQRAGGWERASPLKDRKGSNGADDPERCLRAALKLLSIYPLPRATEHVMALQDQFNGLIETMLEHEQALKQPITRLVSDPHEEERQLASDLEEAIKREQMEIFALQQLHADKQAEVTAAASKPRTRRFPVIKPPLPQPAIDEPNPFAKSEVLEKRAEAIAASGAGPSKASPARSTPATTPRAVRTRAADSSGSNPRSPAKSTPPANSPATRSPASGSPSKRNPAAASPSSLSRETTPRVNRNPAGTRTSPSKLTPKKSNLPVGVTSDDLSQYTTRIWSTIGEALRPWARKTLLARDAEVPKPLESLPLADTIATLRISTTASSDQATSPARSQSSLTTANEDEPTALQPLVALEHEVLDLILSTFFSTPLQRPPSNSLPPLTVFFRDAVLPSSISTGKTTYTPAPPGKKDPMISMSVLKLYLGDSATSRGWSEELASQAIYSLVSKQTLRIERRGKEGPMVTFRLS